MSWIYGAWNGSPVPDGYWASLYYDLQTLRRIARSGDTVDSASVLAVGAVADDLRRKMEHCMAVGGSLGGLIEVTAVAWRDKQREDKTWEVRYMPALMVYDSQPRYKAFNGFAASTEKLAPGEYLVWLVRTGQTGRSGAVVGRTASGSRTATWDLTVP
jgi:hypothetical protein